MRHLAELGVATIVAVSLLAGTAAHRSTQSGADLDHLQRRTMAALDGLTDAEVHQAEVALVYMNLLTESNVDPVVLNAALDRANQSAVASSEAWARFTEASLDLPGEAELRSEFETRLAAGTAAGTELAAVVFGSLTSGDVSAPALQTRLDGIQVTGESSQELLATLDTLIGLYQTELDASVALAASEASNTAALITRGAGLALGLLLVGWALALRSSARRQHAVDADAHERQIEAARNELDARLQRGLAMASDEEASFHVVHAALTELGVHDTEVLVADSSRAHFHQVVATSDDAMGGCGVGTPTQCPAARTGQTQTFASSQAVDACPYLRDHQRAPCSAVCTPINIAGKAVGVMSSIGPLEEVAEPNMVANLELLARKTGERIGGLRTFSKSEIQARTDSLTGLLNRRSVESEASGVLDQGGRYAVAFGDLDHFKRLNDVYGHDTGDRALRLFARVLRDSVRPQDVPARYGGEEFVVVLPGCTAGEAVQVVERVRARLAEAIEGGSTPPFTVSFGVASDDSGLPFADLVSIADAALLTAKAQGRDRTVVGGAAPQDPPPSIAPAKDLVA